MNTNATYHRHAGPHLDSATPQPVAPTPEELNHLALLANPAVHPAPHSPASAAQTSVLTPTGRRIAWIRPTELHSITGELIGRGIDLHTELARRASRAPHTLTRSARRLTTNVARRGPATPDMTLEGLQL